MLADGLEALKKFDWGTDLTALAPIEDATVAAHGNPNVSQDLENHLIAALKENLSRDAQAYVCRKLAIVGTAAAVPTLAGLLGNKATSHMARYALERITAPQAGHALRDALVTVNGNLKIGVISSLGTRRDAEAVATLGSLLRDQDLAVARAAALALGTIGTVESASVLQAALQSAVGDKQAQIDGLLSCAESLLHHGKQADARAIYKSLSGEEHGRLVRLAATRGLLACADQRA
ncbi:MAG TPA: HEAT repeat domain-containing protein [Planctomycetaceae bacterium]|jgi:HEAT repeat protein|nr:HEAT repeat domain-containing protein [Planctomycetaceae bacterium]